MRSFPSFGAHWCCGIYSSTAKISQHSLCFHCSLLNPHKNLISPSSTMLPPLAFNNHPLVTPLPVLTSKIDSSTNLPTTWCWSNDLVWSFRTLSIHHLEDKVPPQVEGNDAKLTHESPTKRTRKKYIQLQLQATCNATDRKIFLVEYYCYNCVLLFCTNFILFLFSYHAHNQSLFFFTCL